MIFPYIRVVKKQNHVTHEIYVFSQILRLLNRSKFQKIVAEHDGDKHCKGLDSWTQLVSMLFMHFAHVESLRDISNGLQSALGDLNHLGIKKAPSKSGLSYRNKHRTHEIFKEYYFQMLAALEPFLQKQKQYARRLKRKIFIMDSSIIPLCLSLIDWAKYRTKKGAFKLHAVLDYGTHLPQYAVIGQGREHDIKAAKALSFPAESVLVMERAYVDYEWLYELDISQCCTYSDVVCVAHHFVVEIFRKSGGISLAFIESRCLFTDKSFGQDELTRMDR